MVADRDLMVQPFLPVFETDGEISHVFLDGAFSHAVRKRPRPGDFRVQEEHGGTAERTEASADLVRQAARALAAAPEPTLYARVDGVVIDGGLVVTELELVEPQALLRLATRGRGPLRGPAARRDRPHVTTTELSLPYGLGTYLSAEGSLTHCTPSTR